MQYNYSVFTLAQILRDTINDETFKGKTVCVFHKLLMNPKSFPYKFQYVKAAKLQTFPYLMSELNKLQKLSLSKAITHKNLILESLM